VANEELLRRVLEQLFEARRIDPELLADDVEWVNPADAVEPGTHQGAEAFNRAISNVFATWDDVHFEIDRVSDGGDAVLALGTLRGHLHDSGMEVTAPHGQVWTFRDGRAVRMEWFNDRDRALEAAGLAE
jgi:ketosteroid isomerase-like protein